MMRDAARKEGPPRETEYKSFSFGEKFFPDRIFRRRRQMRRAAPNGRVFLFPRWRPLMDFDWVTLLVKGTITALFVMTASLISERSGPFWGGLVASLPVVAGPSYVMLAMQADSDFIARSALSSFTAISAIAFFLLVFVRLAPRAPFMLAFGAAILVWFTAAAVLYRFPPELPVAAALNIVSLGLCLWATRQSTIHATARRRTPGRWFDMPVRGVLVGVFVAAVVAISHWIGQVATGLATMFPLSLASLAWLVHMRSGGMAVSATLASALRAIIGLGAALLVLHFMASRSSITVALVAGLGASLVWTAMLIVWNVRGAARTRSKAN
jgi:uncharacterized membrane protein (GlpM family)